MAAARRSTMLRPQGGLLDVNKAPTIIALCVLSSITPLAVLIGPLIISGLVTELGFSAQAAGNMIFAELSGAACSAFLALYWIARCDWRKILWASIATMVLCNMASAMIEAPWPLGVVRFVAGIGVGTVMAATLLTCGMTRNQERVLSFWQTGQIVFAAAALAALPFIFSAIGIRGMYLCLAAVMATLAFAVPFMPQSGGEEKKLRWRELPASTRRFAPVGLVGLLFFFIAMGGVWNFLERIGDTARLDREFIGFTLAGVSACGVLGSVCSAWLGLKWGRMTPFLLGMAVLAVSMLLLYGLSSRPQFILAAFLFKFGWWFISPYILANIMMLDASGKLIAAVNFVIASGQALGPLVVGLNLSAVPAGSSEKMSFTPAIDIGLICLILCGALFISVIRLNDRRAATVAEHG
jgi:predicted MFS family arabinose efflux permease